MCVLNDIAVRANKRVFSQYIGIPLIKILSFKVFPLCVADNKSKSIEINFAKIDKNLIIPSKQKQIKLLNVALLHFFHLQKLNSHLFHEKNKIIYLQSKGKSQFRVAT
jgi:hypothetical protein